MVRIITKTLKKVSAAAFVFCAVFMCAILTPGTAQAAEIPQITGELSDTSKNLSLEGVELTKSLKLINQVQVFTPSVPDVKFTYSVVEDNEWYAADKEDFTPVATGVDTNGTKFEVWRGPKDALKFGKTLAEGTKEGSIIFTHGDTPTADTMTKKVSISINGTAFRRPGVYRYAIYERMLEVDAEEADKKAANVTGNDTEGNLMDDVEGDITLQPTLLYEDGKFVPATDYDTTAREVRFLDVYLTWTSDETGLEVSDVVLHDITGDLSDESESSKREGFSDSIYRTNDLVIGKEIMGKGLTNYDINERKYQFEVTVNAPAGTNIRYAYPARKQNPGPKEERADEKNGVWKLTFEIKQGEYALISGLPAGSTYTVKEVFENSEDAELFETYYAQDMEKMTLTGDNHKDLLLNQSERNVELMKRQGVYYTAVSGGKSAAEAAAEADLTIGRDVDGEIALMEVVNPEAAPNAREANVNNVFYLNVRYDNVVTGVRMGITPFVLMLSVALCATCGFVIFKKAREEEAED